LQHQAVVVAKDISTGLKFCPKINKSLNTDFNGSTKSCNEVQASSQTNSDHEKGREQITLLTYVLYSANSFFQAFSAHGIFKNT
jgi:hypothetical protein